jgi:hypothetical protein
MGELPRGGSIAEPREKIVEWGPGACEGGGVHNVVSPRRRAKTPLHLPDDHYPENMGRMTGLNDAQ